MNLCSCFKMIIDSALFLSKIQFADLPLIEHHLATTLEHPFIHSFIHNFKYQTTSFIIATEHTISWYVLVTLLFGFVIFPSCVITVR